MNAAFIEVAGGSFINAIKGDGMPREIYILIFATPTRRFSVIHGGSDAAVASMPDT
jgi:hypothetical protein